MRRSEQMKAALRGQVRHLRDIHARNVAVLRAQPWRELSGAFGDIGTFMPIFVALSRPEFQPEAGSAAGAPAISAAATLVLSGAANVATGALFGLPLPVQPMKAIAGVAIATPLAFSAANVASAGLFVGGAIALLSALGAVRFAVRFIPLPVVRGIQVAAGLSLATRGAAQTLGAWAGPHGGAEDVLALAAAAAALSLLLVTLLRPRIPFALIVVAASAAVGAAWVGADAVAGRAGLPGFAAWRPEARVPDPAAFRDGALALGVGQIPLTLLNSIVAVVFLAERLFPRGDEGEVAPSPGAPSATAVGLSVGAMNLAGCWFGAMPVCHGSGGLAAQYAFGARSGASVVLLGVLKVALGLCGSEFVLRWSAAFPAPVLGILLALAGMELVKMGAGVNDEDDLEDDEHLDDEGRMRRYVVMMATVAAALGLHNDGIGFVVGVAVHLAYALQDMDRRRAAGAIRIGDEQQGGYEPVE